MDTALLYRPLADGTTYDKLVPFSACTATYVGYDDTFLSLELIRNKAKESISQVKKIAPKLRVSSLSGTVNHIYRFIHDHFQYKADGTKQQVLTFACAWKKRGKVSIAKPIRLLLRPCYKAWYPPLYP